MTGQTTILVKKTDGTSARMTMEEFKIYKNKSLESPKKESVKLAEEPKMKDLAKKDLPVVEPNVLPATSSPVKEIFIDEAKAKRKEENSRKIWTKDDHSSPLEEKVVGARKPEVVQTVLPDPRDELLKHVLSELKFPIKEALWGRLRSLVVSHAKDIRTDDQVLEYSMWLEDKGGLGLTEVQANELLAVIKRIDQKNKFISTSPTKSNVLIDNYSKNDNLEFSGRVFQKKIETAGKPKVMIHDVLPPEKETKLSLGPIDELKEFNLDDFRRLSNNPEKAFEMMLIKFGNFKKESLVLYFEAVKAWRESPLYRLYCKVVIDSLNKKVDVHRNLGDFREGEWDAIIKLCNSL